MANINSIKEQLRRNLVAIISLVVAITSLGYNTWRNERSEDNRTQRLISLEVLLKLGELQQLLYHIHYEREVDDASNLRAGWTLVMTTRDITQVLDAPLPESSGALYATWDERWDELDTSTAAKDAVEADIESLRSDALALLQKLD